jgi:PAS domain S-box-containing protein
MIMPTKEELLSTIDELQNRLSESDQLIEAIKAGEVDAFAVKSNSVNKVFTLQSGDYAYRVLVEKFGEGAVNLAEDGLIVYSNPYFLELTKLPYDQVVGTMFTDFFGDDSKEKYAELFQQGLKGSSRGELNLTVRNEIIPVYISFTSLQPKLATVGVIISDLSDKKKNEQVILQYQKDLERTNIELFQTNTELASFAYIASHDLQEPLRKIQTFSSRIMEKEYENFPSDAKDYFNRIMRSVTRMQNLIEALLDYSRTNNAETIFVKTDLNKIIQEVKNNLGDMLEEKKAILEISSFPTLTVIPIQLTQLFANLLSNALKYSKTGIAPIIKISAEIVSLPEYGLPDEKFWKISVEDNGIGFEQQYESRIFELFQRLHSRSEYEGTGVGLSICKKIVMNHQGFINAIGRPGIGSTFNFYLPEKNKAGS